MLYDRKAVQENIRKVAWGQSKEDDLVEFLTAKILERLK